MSNPKQHHFVPQVYLRNFCADSIRSQLYFLDIVSETTSFTNIRNVAKEKDFYTDVSLEEKCFYEHFFSTDVEPKLGHVIDRIVSSSVLSVSNSTIISEGDRKKLSELLVYQMLRTRKARDFMRVKTDSISGFFIDNLVLSPLFQSNAEYRSIAEKYRVLTEDVFKEISLPIMTDETRVKKFSSILDEMLCMLYVNRTAVGFITGDNPVIIKRLFSNQIGLGSAGLSHPDCTIAFPLTPLLAIIMVHQNPLFSPVLNKYNNRRCPIGQVEIVQTLNKWQLIQATRQVYSQTPISRSTFGSPTHEK